MRRSKSRNNRLSQRVAADQATNDLGRGECRQTAKIAQIRVDNVPMPGATGSFRSRTSVVSSFNGRRRLRLRSVPLGATGNPHSSTSLRCSWLQAPYLYRQEFNQEGTPRRERYLVAEKKKSSRQRLTTRHSPSRRNRLRPGGTARRPEIYQKPDDTARTRLPKQSRNWLHGPEGRQ